jgi:diketogulonate reductase-like aldo/keto reductase
MNGFRPLSRNGLIRSTRAAYSTNPTAVQPVRSFTLLDGTSIPWIGWGNGTGSAQHCAVESGRLALESGIRQLDTAQIYFNESATGEAIQKSSLSKGDVYVTSKRECPSWLPCHPQPLAINSIHR